MPDYTLPQIQACALRLTKLGTNGAPVVGAGNMYVSDSLVSAAWAPEYEDASAIAEKDACDRLAINYKGDDSLKYGTLTLTFTKPDPWVQSFLNAGSLLTSSPVTGLSAPPIGTPTSPGVSLELFVKRIANGTGQDTDYPWAHWVYPWLKNIRLSGFTHENAGLKPVLTAQTFENPLWGNGPINDWPATAASDQMWQWIPRLAAPPAISAGVPGAVLADA